MSRSHHAVLAAGIDGTFEDPPRRITVEPIEAPAAPPLPARPPDPVPEPAPPPTPPPAPHEPVPSR